MTCLCVASRGSNGEPIPQSMMMSSPMWMSVCRCVKFCSIRTTDEILNDLRLPSG